MGRDDADGLNNRLSLISCLYLVVWLRMRVSLKMSERLNIGKISVAPRSFAASFASSLHA